MAMLSYSTPYPNLPPELWTMIFKHAIGENRFFDTPVHIGERVGSPVTLRDPFHVPTGEPADALHAFAHTQQTKKAISVVCKNWRKYSYALLFRHIVIRHVGQLEVLLDILES